MDPNRTLLHLAKEQGQALLVEWNSGSASLALMYIQVI